MNPVLTRRSIARALVIAGILLNCGRGLALASDNASVQKLDISAVQTGKVELIGLLAVPLGTIVEIEARIVEEKSPASVKPGFRYQLQIEKVNGKSLARNLTMNFTVPEASNARMVSSPSELERLIKDLITPHSRHHAEGSEVVFDTPISTAEADIFRRNYVGAKHRILAYECAAISGTPANSPAEYGYINTPEPFALRTFLEIVAEK